MKKVITFIIFFFLIFITLQAQEQDTSLNTSSYTSINQTDCITLDSDNMGSVQECESFLDIGVKVIESDIRQSIILSRNEKEYDLAFSSTVSPSFSSLGLNIEWRHEQGKPENLKGIIVRFDVNDDPEYMDKVSSYLVVSKITNTKICVVAKIAPQKEQNEIAREILDSTEDLACLKEIENHEEK
jgi:hypothetical protein